MAVWQSPSSRSQVRAANNFSKGLNTEISPFFVDESAMIDGYGWDFAEFPAIKTRKGMTLYGSSAEQYPYLMTSYDDQYLIRAVGNAIQYNDPANGSLWRGAAGTYTGGLWSSANFDINGPALVLVNPSSGGYYFKVSGGTGTMTAISSMPAARYVTSDTLRVYAANVSNERDYIYYSKFQDALDWTAPQDSGFLQFYTPSGGGITGIHSFGGSVWVFKKNAYGILYHTGDATLAYRLVPMSDTIGCAASNTIAEVGPYIVFMSDDDVYIGAGDSVSSIGGPIRKYIAAITDTVKETCFAYANGQKYYLFIPGAGKATPDLAFVYDLRFRCWLPYTSNAPGFPVGTIMNGASYATSFRGQTYRLDNGTTDAGTPIPWMIQSRPFDEGVKEAEKELWEMHILGRFSTGSTMTVQVSPRDDATEWYPIEYDPLGTSGATQNKNLIVPLDTMPLCNYYSYRISGTGDVTIQEVQRYSRVQPVQY